MIEIQINTTFELDTGKNFGDWLACLDPGRDIDLAIDASRVAVSHVMGSNIREQFRRGVYENIVRQGMALLAEPWPEKPFDLKMRY